MASWSFVMVPLTKDRKEEYLIAYKGKISGPAHNYRDYLLACAGLMARAVHL